MPWLIEEADWRERSDDQVEEVPTLEADELRALAESLGLRFPDPEDPEYFE